LSVHAPDCGCDTYGCQLRRKGISVPPSATPTRTQRRPFRPGPNNSWEKGRAGEHRRDGSFMPYLNDTGQDIGVKEWADNRTKYEKRLKAVKAGVA
jgi:hypothetical protein